LVDSSTVRPMWPLKGCSGRGNTSWARVVAANNEVTAVLTVLSNILRLFKFVSPSSVASRKSTLSNAQNHSPLAVSRSLPQTKRPRGRGFAETGIRRFRPAGLRKQRSFADGWRKINVPMPDDAGMTTRSCSMSVGEVAEAPNPETLQRLSARHAYKRDRDDQRRPADQRPEKSRHWGSRSDAERCEHLSIHPRAGRIWHEGITKK
jgi:hypothetical protein